MSVDWCSRDFAAAAAAAAKAPLIVAGCLDRL